MRSEFVVELGKCPVELPLFPCLLDQAARCDLSSPRPRNVSRTTILDIVFRYLVVVKIVVFFIEVNVILFLSIPIRVC